MLVSVSIAVIAAVMVVGSIFLIATMLRAVRTLTEIEKLSGEVRLHIAPLSRDATAMMQEATSALRSLQTQMHTVEDSVETVRSAAHRLRHFEEQALERLEEPILELASILSTISRTITLFARALTGSATTQVPR